MDFHKLTLDDKKIYEKYAPAAKGFLGWEYNFAMTYIWNAFDETKIFDAGDMAFVCTKFYGTRVFYPPMLLDPSSLPAAVKRVEAECMREGCDLDIRGLTGEQSKLVDSRQYRVTSDRANSDYIYASQDLIELKGKKFHAKRNYVTRFCSRYAYEFRPYNENTDRDGILALYKTWDTAAQHETFWLEEKVITRALDACSALGLDIAVLCAAGETVAFSVNSVDNPTVAHTFFEKARTDFDGAYQTINQKTAEAYFKSVRYVNRQEDLGIEGLRKAKLSYHPAVLLEKYRIQRASE